MMNTTVLNKITPHLWFDKQARQAAEFYTSIFKGSKIKRTTTLHNTPSGSVEIVVIEIMGQEFSLMSAGPYFKFNPAISFLVQCETEEEVEALWAKLSEGGTTLMALGKYPFSEKYGWLQDRYGLSWQLMFMGSREIRQKLIPTLMFVGSQSGKAEEAIDFYASIFNNSEVGTILRYGRDEAPDKEGTLKYSRFTIEGHELAAMDSARGHEFGFNEAVSFIIHCDTQDEVDYYWEELSSDPNAEMCGWLKDKYGLSWQVVPRVMEEMLATGDEKKLARVTESLLKMKKLDIEELRKAYGGNG